MQSPPYMICPTKKNKKKIGEKLAVVTYLS